MKAEVYFEPSYFIFHPFSMSFKSLNQILGSIQEQSKWEEQPFRRLVKCWAETVGAAVATHTRPVSIQRDVLWVATSSAVWAQELSFGRQRILEKLNAHLPAPLLDIRFSTAGWQPQNSKPIMLKPAKADVWRDHPSRVLTSLPTHNQQQYQHPNEAFSQWAMRMQARSRNLPLCSQCHCPTPEGELQRWGMCAICAAKQW